LEHALRDRQIEESPRFVHYGDRGVQLPFDPLHGTIGRGRDRAVGTSTKGGVVRAIVYAVPGNVDSNGPSWPPPT
jgi:hypothetical protein